MGAPLTYRRREPVDAYWIARALTPHRPTYSCGCVECEEWIEMEQDREREEP